MTQKCVKHKNISIFLTLQKLLSINASYFCKIVYLALKNEKYLYYSHYS